MEQTDLVMLHNELVKWAPDKLSKTAEPYPFASPAAADELVKDLEGHTMPTSSPA
jgi:hypothetical protein